MRNQKLGKEKITMTDYSAEMEEEEPFDKLKYKEFFELLTEMGFSDEFHQLNRERFEWLGNNPFIWYDGFDLIIHLMVMSRFFDHKTRHPFLESMPMGEVVSVPIADLSGIKSVGTYYDPNTREITTHLKRLSFREFLVELAWTPAMADIIATEYKCNKPKNYIAAVDKYLKDFEKKKRPRYDDDVEEEKVEVDEKIGEKVVESDEDSESDDFITKCGYSPSKKLSLLDTFRVFSHGSNGEIRRYLLNARVIKEICTILGDARLTLDQCKAKFRTYYCKWPLSGLRVVWKLLFDQEMSGMGVKHYNDVLIDGRAKAYHYLSTQV